MRVGVAVAAGGMDSVRGSSRGSGRGQVRDKIRIRIRDHGHV